MGIGITFRIMLTEKGYKFYKQKAIRGLEDMTNYDLFTACGGCFIGSESDYGERMQDNNEATNDLSDYFDSKKH